MTSAFLMLFNQANLWMTFKKKMKKRDRKLKNRKPFKSLKIKKDKCLKSPPSDYLLFPVFLY